VQLPAVQTWLVARVTARLSHDLHTTIRIKKVNFSLFNKMILEGAGRGCQKDTLLYAGAIKVNITDWWFFKDKAQLQYIGLEDATIKLQRDDSVWNYQFIANYFSGGPDTGKSILPKSPLKDTTKSLQLDLKEVDLSNIHILKRDGWRGENMDLRLKGLELYADTISFSDKIARIRNLTFTKPDFILTDYTGRRPTPPDDTSTIINDPLHLRLNPAGWDITANDVTIRNGSFRHEQSEDTVVNKYFDGNHIYFYAVNSDWTNFRLNRDTITAQLQLSTKERSGLEIKRLNSRIKWYPEAMEFARLDLQTNKSHLRNYFAMRFKTLDDMSDFVTRIHMEAHFSDSDIDSDDIAWFAPDLGDWKKHIRITGDIRGTIEDLRGRQVVLQAGKNTLLNGDIHLKGLPDIQHTFIEFKSNDFRTTYEDMAALVPSIKKVQQPRIDQVEYLRFKGRLHRHRPGLCHQRHDRNQSGHPGDEPQYETAGRKAPPSIRAPSARTASTWAASSTMTTSARSPSRARSTAPASKRARSAPPSTERSAAWNSTTIPISTCKSTEPSPRKNSTANSSPAIPTWTLTSMDSSTSASPNPDSISRQR
jgi:hypothetical protein